MNNPYEKDHKEYRICSTSGKRCYSSKEADITISSARKCKYRKNRMDCKKIPRRKYYCKDCQSYHLTSTSWTRDRKSDKHKVRYIKTLWN